jgi:hypothetical protein
MIRYVNPIEIVNRFLENGWGLLCSLITFRYGPSCDDLVGAFFGMLQERVLKIRRHHSLVVLIWFYKIFVKRFSIWKNFIRIVFLFEILVPILTIFD